MNNDDAARIAAELEPDEIIVISLMIPGKAHHVATFYPMLKRLREKNLLEVFVGAADFLTRLTPLGVAVREEIGRRKDG